MKNEIETEREAYNADETIFEKEIQPEHETHVQGDGPREFQRVAGLVSSSSEHDARCVVSTFIVGT